MMAVFAVSLLAVIGFGFGFWYLNIVSTLRQLSASAMQGISAMLDSEMDELHQERVVRQSGLALMGHSGQILWRFAGALLAAAFPVLIADALHLADSAQVIALMLRLDYIIGISVVALVLGRLLARRNPSAPTTAGHYSNTDRFAHMLAFSGPRFQRSAAALDDMAARRKARSLETEAPIFITSLARGGTTALLNAMSEIDGLATHRYRDMPFISAPYLWSIFGRQVARRVSHVERAHGDGLKISANSPEAFDEIFWKLLWPEKYQHGTIELWKPEDFNSDAQHFFEQHFRKICYLRNREAHSPSSAPWRYLSKNNANIARLQLLPEMFPGCRIIVPIRRPGAHAMSLLRQHRNFSRLQQENDFTRRYMRDIGHLEFGQLHQPIAFPDFMPKAHRPDEPDYWLAYWISAFKDFETMSNQCHIITQDDLRQHPQATLGELVKLLDIDAGTMDFRRFFHSEPDEDIRSGFSAPLLQEAHKIYDELAGLSVAPGRT